jgi:hypothetical protein
MYDRILILGTRLTLEIQLKRLEIRKADLEG